MEIPKMDSIIVPESLKKFLREQEKISLSELKEFAFIDEETGNFFKGLFEVFTSQYPIIKTLLKTIQV